MIDLSQRATRTPNASWRCLLLPLLLASCGAAGSEDSTEDPTVPAQHPPGATPYSETLRAKLSDALAARGEGYQPRTHHLSAGGQPHYTNRLILEDSPYLLQHAHNPVDWYPWGTEAFERAKAEDKPIFLSIGYSTCHWCHVMERESFEDLEVARLMNRYFVCVKVDRERRPDVDDFYMTAVQVLGQRGGWPMSSFLTPDGEPFFGATYFPPDRFADLLERVHAAWADQRGQLVSQARQVTERVRRVTAARGTAQELEVEVFARAVGDLQQSHDERLGGFGGAPKFPHEPELLFLLARSLRHGDREALAIAETSLDAMARGGIYDQVGGGFHRYSVDARWLVPHFEKMLYNQAHLARAYAAVYRLTVEPFHARVARQTLDYFLREMTDPEGGFYSATDADSSGGEGEFFIWTPDELRAALPAEDAELAIALWGVTAAGNFEGKNILHLPRGFDAFAAAEGLELDALLRALHTHFIRQVSAELERAVHRERVRRSAESAHEVGHRGRVGPEVGVHVVELEASQLFEKRRALQLEKLGGARLSILQSNGGTLPSKTSWPSLANATSTSLPAEAGRRTPACIGPYSAISAVIASASSESPTFVSDSASARSCGSVSLGPCSSLKIPASRRGSVRRSMLAAAESRSWRCVRAASSARPAIAYANATLDSIAGFAVTSVAASCSIVGGQRRACPRRRTVSSTRSLRVTRQPTRAPHAL